MLAFVGLGNVGDKYAATKHNAGFWVINELAERMQIAFSPGKGDYVVGKNKRSTVLLAKPTTGMNVSGLAVNSIMSHFDIDLNAMHIIVDDIDLPLGTLRIRPHGGDGCHRGMESVIYQIHNDQFPRIRIGIKTNEQTRPAEKFVLKPFRKDDQLLAESVIKRAADAIEMIIHRGLQATMTEYNRTNTNVENAK
jgi:PTH1 family peptidyl-tRNA hydrolase